MNPEIKAKWVAALRSGEYAQAQGHLKDETGYCCLGVLCVVSEQETGFGIAKNRKNHGDETIGPTIRKWADLPISEGALVIIESEEESLATHNDSGKTFLQIADAIEEQL